MSNQPSDEKNDIDITHVNFYFDNTENKKAIDYTSYISSEFMLSVIDTNRSTFSTTDYKLELENNQYSIQKCSKPLEDVYLSENFYINNSSEATRQNPGRDILRSCLTSSQIGASNQKGNYGDLARNSVIAKPMEIGGKFDSTYASFNLASTIAFFLGSTDGGVANTVLDRDLYALCNYITTNGGTLGKTRGYRLYSVRSLPYKKHTTSSSDAKVQADAERILKQMVAQSMGVIGNIKRKTNYVRSGNQTTDYILDALFLAGYNVPNSGAFSDTNRYAGGTKEAHTENQSHMSHGTEMVAALMMIDVLNYSLPTSATEKAIYAYNAEESANSRGVLHSTELFSPFTTSFPCERTIILQRMDALELDIGTKIRNAIHMYAFLIQFQSDLIAASNEKESAFKGRGSLRTVPEIEALLKGIYDKGFMKAGVIKWDQVGEIAANFNSLMNALKELAKFVYEVQKNTVFGNTRLPRKLKLNLKINDTTNKI